jgi:hypothetical protein
VTKAKLISSPPRKQQPRPPAYPECKIPRRCKFKGLMSRSLLVTLHPSGWIELQEGRGRAYSLPLMTIYRLAIEGERESKRRKGK